MASRNTRPARLTRCIMVTACITVAIIASTPLRADRGWRQGDMWLKWNDQARAAYVLGYFEARSQLQGRGCRLAPDRWAGGVNIEQVAASVTTFYARYPEDRDIYIWEVIEQFGRGLTIEQIHSYPFPSHHNRKH